ncbi:hypothetical protein OG618_36250 [Kitasatospora sp. NBC_01246]|uniref:hypothetical protein n=1 Tax=Kitasatospora sp. NBC_01246 TaxID=2903570 RepID=UPI002E36E39C|nr:hypothetical protein [Kitasatospora sp. NBC_01246]
MDSDRKTPANRARALQRFPRHDRRGEARLPAVLATQVAMLLYLLLPEQLLFLPRFVLPGLELLLLIPLNAVNSRRMTRQNHFSRIVSLTLVALIGITDFGLSG